MNPQQTRANYEDAIAGAILISIGTLALIVRLGVLTVSLVPQELVRWWPLLLIVVGVGLWAIDHDCRLEHQPRREAKYVK